MEIKLGSPFEAVADGLTLHPVTAIFPEMVGEEWESFLADVRAKGVTTPIVLSDGQVIDGRHRLRAARELGQSKIPAVTIAAGDAAAYAISANLHRRHLTTDQRSAIAVELATLGRGGDPKTRANAQNCALDQSDSAALLKVSRRSVQYARAVKTAAPELHEEVTAGRMRAGDARRLKDAPKEVREKAVEIARRGDGKAVNALSKKTRGAATEIAVAKKAKVELRPLMRQGRPRDGMPPPLAPQERRIPLGRNPAAISTTLRAAAAPLIAGLFEEGKKNAATFSPGTVSTLAQQLAALIDNACETLAEMAEAGR